MPRTVVPRDPSRTRSQSAGQAPDDYLTRVAKYIPGEVVTVYVSIQGIIEGNAGTSPAEKIVAYLVALVILVLGGAVYLRRSAVKSGLPWKTQVVISSVSFLIWIYALGGFPTALNIYSVLWAALALPLWTFIIGIVDPGEKPDAPTS